MTHPLNPSLPIDEVLPKILKALESRAHIVIVAPPGAGKTTRAPLALLDAAWSKDRKLILLEPRRLAARAAANRMARLLGEAVGETIGLRMRLETKVSAKTRLEVVTEGVFARMIIDDPSLENIAGVIFDEYHERSLDADIGLALTLDVQAALRNDLRVIVMSATLDSARIAALMNDAPVIISEGRAFDVDVRYLGRQPNERLEEATLRAIHLALREEQGSILVFLPGQAEIQRVANQLRDLALKNIDIAPLYGALERQAQDWAISSAEPGRRKITLATSIAETSLTIEGVRIVIDCGLSRIQHYEPDLGLTRLETVRAARSSVDQRTGRAGRTEPGICYRLWDEPQTNALATFAKAEILAADLSNLVLDLSAWGVNDPQGLNWLDPPPIPAWTEALTLARSLGAIDLSGRLTARGKALRAIPLPPRLACMILTAASHGEAERAGRLAVLLTERGLGGDNADLTYRYDRFQLDQSPRAISAKRLAAHWARQAKENVIDLVVDAAQPTLSDGALIAFAFPDRLAKSRGAKGDFLMANGRAAYLPEEHPLSRAPYLAVAEIIGRAARAQILAACALTEKEIEMIGADRLTISDETTFDATKGALRRRKIQRLGAIRLNEQNLAVEPSLDNAIMLAQGVALIGLERLLWTKEQLQTRHRVNFLYQAEGQGSAWPDLSDNALEATLENWLAPFIIGRTSLLEITQEDLSNALSHLLPYDLMARLEREAPAFFETPAGSRHALDYAAANGPLLSVRVQELYGLSTHPTIAGGRVALSLEILSPAHRPIQTTRDLPSFWKGSWHEVKKEMKGRYPRHEWPDDPACAQPTLRARPRSTS